MSTSNILTPNNQNPKRTSQSQEVNSRIKYKITPEEMWNCIKGSSQNWGIEGYEITKKYYDYRQVKWEQERKRILDAHKKEWPPQNWPKNKETDKLEPPKKTTFIDEQIAWSNSFNDPKKSEEVKQNLEGRGTFKYPDKKQYPNLRDKFLKDEKEKKEKFDQLPKIQPWKENGIEDAKRKIEDDKSKVKTQWQKNLERYPKEKPWWSRADRITVTSDAEYVGENIPFYYNNNKNDDGDTKDKKIFYPNKEFVLRRAPKWAFQGKNPTKLPTDNMKAREELIKEKVENLKNSKNLTDKDLQIDVMGSHEKIRRRGRHFFEYKKPYDYGNTEQYKLNKEQHPSFSPGPTHYWKDRLKEFDINARPKDVVEDAEVNGKPSKIYYMHHKRTDFRQYKPMRKSVF
jgi:hypothetical protein